MKHERGGNSFATWRGWSMQSRLVGIFLLVQTLPLFLLGVAAWRQLDSLGELLKNISTEDSTAALNAAAVKNIERMTTDIAWNLSEFLYARDNDILHTARLEPNEESYRIFLDGARRRLLEPGRWELAPDGVSWRDAEKRPLPPPPVSSNSENNDLNGFRYFQLETADFVDAPLYDEITFLDLDGRELVKVVAPDSRKRRHPLSPDRRDVSRRENTYVKAETYFPELKKLRPGEIYVSDVVGAYVGANYIGVYTPGNVAKAAADRGYPIDYSPETQAYAGRENPLGRRFEGIIRWATPVAGGNGETIGYVTLALNHDHLMEFVDHVTPLDERYAKIPSAHDGNYAFIWDYRCRNICHPRHHSIVGFDPETGEPQVPWLETSIYEGWRKSGLPKWTDYVKGYPPFHEQSRSKRPAPQLTREGLLGLDGRYLNNAPQCVGWMDLTRDGGSGSFYILWSGVYKLTTAAAIPYYTGQYAPSEANGFSRRGFGIVTIGSGMDYFTASALETELKLKASIEASRRASVAQLSSMTALLSIAMILAAIGMARRISRPIRAISEQMSRLATGEIGGGGTGHEAFRSRGDEIGLLAKSLGELVAARREELEMVNAIAMGDYTRTISLRSNLDLLGKALNTMIRVNKNALAQVNRAVGQVGDGAEAVSSVSVSLSQGVQTSEKAMREISDNIDAVDRQAHDNAASARDANQLAIAGRDAAGRGYEAMTELTAAMAEIQQSGNKIASVAKLIDDIAFQTNLLALNASVEAARAGRQGKGFSVVADEVRNLSARSAKAAHETEEMVESMLRLMETGAKLAERSDREFREIVSTIAQVVKLFESIAGASNAQSSAMSQIVETLGRIDLVVQKNSRNAREMSDSSSALSRQAEDLRRMVSRFRLDDAPGDGRGGRETNPGTRT